MSGSAVSDRSTQVEDNTDRLSGHSQGSQLQFKGDECLIEVKITVITENKFWDFDYRPLNTVLLNTGSTVIGLLKNSQVVLKVNPPGLKLSKSFPSVVRFVTGLIRSKKHCLICDQIKLKWNNFSQRTHSLTFPLI